MTDDSIMTFGKYKGYKLIAIPDSYLIYLYDEGIAKGELKVYIETHVAEITNRLNKGK